MPYEAIPVDTRKGEQHKPEYLAINPNAKLPAIVDGDVTVFDSNAILLYLAEKTGKFLPPKSDKARGELLSWLMFVATGVGPYSGQSVHFRNFAPEKIAYAINRYAFEAQRHFGILDARLAKQKYMLGDVYTIVDMDVWGWARLIRNGARRGSLDEIPEPQAFSRRNYRSASGPARGGTQGQAQFQDRNGRRGAQSIIPPYEREGRIKRSLRSIGTGIARKSKGLESRKKVRDELRRSICLRLCSDSTIWTECLNSRQMVTLRHCRHRRDGRGTNLPAKMA